MLDLTAGTSQTESVQSTSRPSFRRRLLAVVGPGVAVALAVLAVLAWAAVHWSLHRTALETLQGEIKEMTAAARIDEGGLVLDDYAWEEAHHRLAVPRVDPIFVQVFDANRRPVRASGNVDSLGAGFPDRVLDARAPSLWPSLHTIRVGERTLYYRTRPLRDASGAVQGYVQVARDVPPHDATLARFGAALGALWLLLGGGLLLLVSWAAGRVLEPLREVTAVARSVTSADLDARVDVPDGADRETATLGRAFNALLDRIQDHVNALRAFTSNAAHELQTPLTVLRGHVEIALRRERSADEYRETLELLDDRLGRLVDTLRALLTLTRLDRDATLDAEPVDLAALVSEEVASFQPRAAESGVELSVETAGAAGEDGDAAFQVDGQPELLREAVRNLVDNALKYTDEGRVSVRLDAGEDTVTVSCRDTGVGIDADDLPKVGDRFFRSADASQTGGEGSGLGLAIVSRIVDRHGGRLQVRSEPGTGTEFRIVLPRRG